MDKRFYSVAEAAAELEVTTQTVRNRIREGSIPAVQGTTRGSYKIPVGSFRSYMRRIGVLSTPAFSIPMPEPRTRTAQEIYDELIVPELDRVGVKTVEALATVAPSPEQMASVRELRRLYQFYARALSSESRRAEEAAQLLVSLEG
jgi:excisionase family DNA binding protein